MKKRFLSLALALLLVLSLCACGKKAPPAAGVEEPGGTQAIQSPEREEPAPTQAPEETPEPSPSPEAEEPAYQPGQWLTDNVSVSFYMNYVAGGENTLNTLNVYGDKALLTATKEGSDAPPSRTLYQQTDAGVSTYSLMEFGESKSAILLENEGKTLLEFLPTVFIVAGTIEERALNEKLLNSLTRSGEDTVAGRPCAKYGSTPSVVTQTLWVDDEFGMILKSQIATTRGGETTVVSKTLVTELKYEALTEADVTVDLSGYEIS